MIRASEPRVSFPLRYNRRNREENEVKLGKRVI